MATFSLSQVEVVKNNIKMISFRISYFLLIITCCLISFSCMKDSKTSIAQDDNLSLSKTQYLGNQLRIDGFYYSLFEGKLNRIYILHPDGILTYFGVSDNVSLLNAESYINGNEIKDLIQNNKYCWGLFIINGNEIKTCAWHPSNNSSKIAWNEDGKIINDSTFQINELYRLVNNQKTEQSNENEIYYFKKTTNKPSSNNKFIP